MRRLALITWRLPHVGLARLERARRALANPGWRGELEGPGTVFTFATCQRALACTLAEDPLAAAETLAHALGPAGGERLTGRDAFTHLAHVAASLDALVPGEDQVPHQFRDELARQEDQLDPGLLDRLQRVRSLARKARDAGGLTGHEGRSVMDLAAPLLPAQGPLAVVGTGTIARQAVQTLVASGPVHVVSRRHERALEVAADPEQAWQRETFLTDPPPLAGLVLSTRAPEQPVIDQAAGRRLRDARAGPDALTIVDVGVPRNADPSLERLAGLQVRTLEDLARIARCSPVEDTRVHKAREALQRALAAQRHRRRGHRLDERIVALRQALADELDELAPHVDGLSEDARQAWIHRAHGRVSHTSQRHLEAALRRDPPP